MSSHQLTFSEINYKNMIDYHGYTLDRFFLSLPYYLPHNVPLQDFCLLEPCMSTVKALFGDNNDLMTVGHLGYDFFEFIRQDIEDFIDLGNNMTLHLRSSFSTRLDSPLVPLCFNLNCIKKKNDGNEFDNMKYRIREFFIYMQFALLCIMQAIALEVFENPSFFPNSSMYNEKKMFPLYSPFS